MKSSMPVVVGAWRASKAPGIAAVTAAVVPKINAPVTTKPTTTAMMLWTVELRAIGLSAGGGDANDTRPGCQRQRTGMRTADTGAATALAGAHGRRALPGSGGRARHG